MRCSGRPDHLQVPTEIRVDHSDDNIVTRFCEVVTPPDTSATLRRARLATTEMGEAMAPAPESPPSGGNRSGAGAAPIQVPWIARVLPGPAADGRDPGAGIGRPRGISAVALLAAAIGVWLGLAACDDGPPAPRLPQVAPPGRAAADPALGVTTPLDGAAPQLAAAV